MLRMPLNLLLVAGLSLPSANAAFAEEPSIAAAPPKLADAIATQPAEFIYVPIKPCRVFSKRIEADVPSHFQITGAGDLTSQGGPVTGCGVPASAKSVAITFSTMKPAVTGSLTAYAKGASRPGTASARFNKGAYETTGANVEVSSAGLMSIYPSEAVSAIGDVTGYYAPPLAGFIQSSGAVYSSTGRIVESGRYSAGLYYVGFDRDVRTCVPLVTAYNTASFLRADTYIEAAANRIRFTAYNSNGAVMDTWFYLHVQC